jgi:hypothetical protein
MSSSSACRARFGLGVASAVRQGVVLLALWISLLLVVVLCGGVAGQTATNTATATAAAGASITFPAPNGPNNRVLGVMLSYDFGHIDPLVIILGEYVSMCEGVLLGDMIALCSGTR